MKISPRISELNSGLGVGGAVFVVDALGAKLEVVDWANNVAPVKTDINRVRKRIKHLTCS